MGRGKSKDHLPKPAEHGEQSLQTLGFSRPDGRAQVADVAFWRHESGRAGCKGKRSAVEKQLEQARQRTSALSFLEPDQAEFRSRPRNPWKKLWKKPGGEGSPAAGFPEDAVRHAPLEPDWEEKSQYRSTANGEDASYTTGYSYNPGYDYGFATSIPQETGFQDERYDYINKNPQAIKLVDNNDTITGSYFLGLDKNYLKQMTGEEVKTPITSTPGTAGKGRKIPGIHYPGADGKAEASGGAKSGPGRPEIPLGRPCQRGGVPC